MKLVKEAELRAITGGQKEMIFTALPHTMGPDGLPGSGRSGGAQIRAISGIRPWSPGWWK